MLKFILIAYMLISLAQARTLSGKQQNYALIMTDTYVPTTTRTVTVTTMLPNTSSGIYTTGKTTIPMTSILTNTPVIPTQKPGNYNKPKLINIICNGCNNVSVINNINK